MAYENKGIVITGASHGIRAELARRLAEERPGLVVAAPGAPRPAPQATAGGFRSVPGGSHHRSVDGMARTSLAGHQHEPH